MVELLRHRQTKGAENGYVRPTTTAPHLDLYEGPRVKKLFRDQHFFFPFVSRGSRERKSALMTWTTPCLAAMSGQPPEPGGSRRKARGVDGESACQATMVPVPLHATNVTAFSTLLLIPLSSLKCRITFGQLIQGGALFAMRHSPHQLISGRNRVPYQDPSCIIARAQGSKGDGTILYRGVFQPCRDPVTHPPWKRCILFVSSLRRFYLLLRTAPSGTTPVSR
jgi:hypothetical protein